MRKDSFENSRDKLMFLYELTQKDMFADPDVLSNELLRYRFLIEFGQVPAYFGFVAYSATYFLKARLSTRICPDLSLR